MKLKTYCVVYTQFESIGDGRICNITKITTFDNLLEAKQCFANTIINLLKINYDKLEAIDRRAIDDEIREIGDKTFYHDDMEDEFELEIIESE